VFDPGWEESPVADRSIRDFQVPYSVATVADAWAVANGFALDEIEPDGTRHYVRGSGLLTGQMMCVVRQFGPHVRIEAYIRARMVARASALFLIPENMSVEPGGFMGALPKNMCRAAVDKLLAQFGQPPISAADNAAGPTIGVAPLMAPGQKATDFRPLGISILAIAEVVNAVICFTVVRDYWWAFNSRASYDDMNWAAVDLVFSLAYLAMVGGSVAVAWRMWMMRRDAWLPAVQLSATMVALTAVSSLIWGFETIGIVGIVVHAGILGYLNMAPVRALFGRGALTVSGGAS
jgi:hypothetical protein